MKPLFGHPVSKSWLRLWVIFFFGGGGGGGIERGGVRVGAGTMEKMMVFSVGPWMHTGPWITVKLTLGFYDIHLHS